MITLHPSLLPQNPKPRPRTVAQMDQVKLSQIGIQSKLPEWWSRKSFTQGQLSQAFVSFWKQYAASLLCYLSTSHLFYAKVCMINASLSFRTGHVHGNKSNSVTYWFSKKILHVLRLRSLNTLLIQFSFWMIMGFPNMR